MSCVSCVLNEIDTKTKIVNKNEVKFFASLIIDRCRHGSFKKILNKSLFL